VGRRSRKRGRRGVRSRSEAEAAHARPPSRPEATAAQVRPRSAERDAAARAALKPLGEGERPTAVTVGALVALGLAVANVASYLAGVEIRGDQPALAGVLGYSGLMLLVAGGMWRARYWGVLGMQTLLALLIIIFAVVAVTAANVAALLISVAVIAAAGTLFWYLVKAMARIQMPTRP
jgi:hypothetical protein